MVDNNNNKIQAAVAAGKTFSGLTGTITWYYGWLEFIPTADVTLDATPAFTVEPEEIDLDEFRDNQEGLYEKQSKFVTIKNVYFKDDATMTYKKNYAMCKTVDGAVVDSAVRVHYDCGITYQTNKTTAVNIEGVLIFDTRYGGIRLSPRSNADITNAGDVAIEDVKIGDASLVLSPVPVKDVLTVSMLGAVSVSVYNSGGALVTEKQGIKNTTTINVANLANGIYFIRVADSKGVVVTKKFVKG